MSITDRKNDYFDGRDAALSSASRRTNPHPPGTGSYNEWDAGWRNGSIMLLDSSNTIEVRKLLGSGQWFAAISKMIELDDPAFRAEIGKMSVSAARVAMCQRYDLPMTSLYTFQTFAVTLAQKLRYI